MKVIADNKKAKFDYEWLEKFEAGIQLKGHEVKSLKTRGVNLAGTYILLKKNAKNPNKAELFWIGAKIAPYQPYNTEKTYNPERDRKLLLNDKEIRYLIGKSQEKGLTLVPIMLYTKTSFIKLEFAIAKGKKKADKRETIKKRDIDRQIRTELKLRG